MSRGSLTGPKYVDADMSVAKRFKITESAGLTFQASYFNLFNHPNFAIPDANIRTLLHSRLVLLALAISASPLRRSFPDRAEPVSDSWRCGLISNRGES